jgi:DNA-binding transcriptional MerR regulator
MSSGLNIAALSRRTGIAPDTLRKWEQRYGILRPTRTDGGQRRYSEHDVDRVLWLKARLGEGYRIGEAADLLGLESDATSTRPDQLSRLIFDAAQRSDAAAVNRLLDHAFAHDLETAYAGIVQPLLVAVGDAWHAGSFSIGQEHLVTGAVRARLERKLAEVRAPVHGRAVLACAPGERHELGLLMLAILLRADGWDVAYLGPDMPVDEALALAGDVGAQLMCFSVGMGDAAAALEAGLAKAERPAGIRVLIGGYAATAELAQRVGALHLGADLGAAIESLRSHAPAVAAG